MPGLGQTDGALATSSSTSLPQAGDAAAMHTVCAHEALRLPLPHLLSASSLLPRGSVSTPAPALPWASAPAVPSFSGDGSPLVSFV